MISRHFLRAKVLQTVYAANTDPVSGPTNSVDVVAAEKNFTHNISRLNDLGVLQLSMLEHFVEVAGVMMEEARHKFMPTEAELNPNPRLLNNRLIRKLAENPDYRSHVKESGVNWGGVEYDAIFRQAYSELVRLSIYRDYLASGLGETSEAQWLQDQEFAMKLFKYLVNYPQLREVVCPQSLLWEDDFDQIAQYDFKILRTMDETFGEDSVVPLVCDPRDEADAMAYEFAHQLLLDTMRHREEVEDMIRKNLQGWEFDRVAGMDILLINMAVAELTDCPSIPERVTVDEYIELSKEFSSERSRLFINGILGKFILILRSEGRIKKTGRGMAGFGEKEDEEHGMDGIYEVPSDEEPVPVVTVRKSRPRIKRVEGSHTENTD